MRRIGVDIGGTFTDCLLAWDGQQILSKSLTTHHNLALGFTDAAGEMDRAVEFGERWIEGTFFRRARTMGNDIGYDSIVGGGQHATTLHWIDNTGRITPGEMVLLDMGVEDYLLTSTVNGILAQRLVRRLDRTTAAEYEALPEVVKELKLDTFTEDRPVKLFKPGTSSANPTGYYGRTTIMEFLVMTDNLRRMIMQHAGMGDLEEAARKEGMRTMYEDGLVKALAGTTTIEEVLRVTQERLTNEPQAVLAEIRALLSAARAAWAAAGR